MYGSDDSGRCSRAAAVLSVPLQSLEHVPKVFADGAAWDELGSERELLIGRDGLLQEVDDLRK